jgi:hypothetical protein
VKKTRKRKKKATNRGGAPAPARPTARIPLPKKGEKRHGDRTKYERARERERLRRELGR